MFQDRKCLAIMSQHLIKRLFRISLRGLLVVVTLLCVLLAFKVRQVERQKAAIAWVEQHGGAVWNDFEMGDSGYYVANPKPPGPDWLRRLVGTDYLSSPISANIDNDALNDISRITALSKLRFLSVTSRKLHDLSPITKLELRELLLVIPPNDKEIAELRKTMPDCEITWSDVTNSSWTPK